MKRLSIFICIILSIAFFSLSVQGASSVYAFDGLYWNTVASGTIGYRVDGTYTRELVFSIEDGSFTLAGQSYNYISLETASQVSANGTKSISTGYGTFEYNLHYMIPLSLNSPVNNQEFNFIFSLLNNTTSLKNAQVYVQAWYDIVSWAPPVSFSSSYQLSDLGGGRYGRTLTIDLTSSYGCQYIDVYLNIPNFSSLSPMIVYLPSQLDGSQQTSQEILNQVVAISEQLEEIYASRPGDEEDIQNIESGFTAVDSQFESMADALGAVTTVPPGDVALSFDDIFGDNYNPSVVSSVFAPITGNPLFLMMTTGVLSIALISYVLFGKKGH